MASDPVELSTGRDSVDAEIDRWIAQMPGTVDARVETARQRIGRISRQFESVLLDVAAGAQLSVGDLEALSVLQRTVPHTCTPTDLAVTLGLTSGTVSVRIDRLIRAELVEQVSAADGRSRPIRLTRKGRRRWATATEHRTAHEERIFRSALTERQLDDLNRLLRALLCSFEDEQGAVSRHDRLSGH